MGETPREDFSNFQFPKPEASSVPEDSYEKIVEEKMCVLRSLASVGETFIKGDVELDRSQVTQRLKEMEAIEKQVSEQIARTVDKQKLRGEIPRLPVFELPEIISKGTSQDKLNIKNLVASLIKEGGQANTLEKSLSGAVANFESVHGYENLRRILQNPKKQVCLILAGHMMHVSLNQEGRLTSLSDKKDGMPQPVGEVMAALHLFKAPEDYNAIVFSKVERVAPNDLDRVDDKFLEVTADDPDFLLSSKQIASQGDHPLYPPDAYLAKDGIYPEVNDYKEPNRETGKLEPAEAIALGSLSRKIAVLKKAFGNSYELNKQMKQLFLKQAGEVTPGKIPSELWFDDITSGMTEFVNYMNIVAQVRERSPGSQESKLAGKKKNNNRTNAQELAEEHTRLFTDPLRQDNNKIGPHSVEKLLDYMADANPISEQNPGGADTAKELEDRIRSRNLGLEIARKFYLETMALSPA